MRNTLIGGTFAALVCSVALTAAQAPRPSAAPPAPRPSVAGAGVDTKKVTDDNATVVGCVQPGAGPKTFVLAESPSPLAPVGDAAPAAKRDHGTRYDLFTSDGSIDLAKLVGRQVEANGTLSKPAVSSDEKKRTTESDALSKFTAKSIRETGASC